MLRKPLGTHLNTYKVQAVSFYNRHDLKMKITWKNVLNLLCLMRCVLTCSSYDSPKVRIDSGEISGGYEYTFNGRKLYSFLGVPYASAPLQNYRFKVGIVLSEINKLKIIFWLINFFFLRKRNRNSWNPGWEYGTLPHLEVLV